MFERPSFPIIPSDQLHEQRITALNDALNGVGNTAAPAANAPTSPQITQGLTGTGVGVRFKFQESSSTSVDGYRVYRNSTNGFSSAMAIRYIKHSPGAVTTIEVDDVLSAGAVGFYWVTAVSTSGVESPPSAVQAGSVTSGSVVGSAGGVVVGGVTAVDSSGNLLLKNARNVFGTTSGPTTSSTSYSTVSEMAITITTSGNNVFLSFTGNFSHSTGGAITLAFFRGSTQISRDLVFNPVGVAIVGGISFSIMDTGVTAGSNSFSLQWKVSAGTATATATQRQMQAIELG